MATMSAVWDSTRSARLTNVKPKIKQTKKDVDLISVRFYFLKQNTTPKLPIIREFTCPQCKA